MAMAAGATHQRDSLSEFLVVIMAGGTGSRMAPISEGFPKALLPVANRPLITYVLESFEKTGFQDAIVVYRQSHRNEMKKFFEGVYPQQHGHLRVDCCCVDDDIGTADALRQIKDKIKSDFIVASCDFIADAPLHHALDLHREHDATLTSVTFKTPKIEDGKKQRLDTGIQHFIGTDPSGTRLVSYSAAVDIEEELSVRLAMLRKFPSVNLFGDISDAHLYIFKRWVINYIADNDGLSSLQGEVIPLLVKAQFRDVLGTTEVGRYLSVSDESDRLVAPSGVSHRNEDCAVTCCAYHLSSGSPMRVNTTALYWEANRVLSKGVGKDRVHTSVESGAKAVIGHDSLVGEGTRLGEHVSVKKSIIGSHCIVGANCKINNSIIMDYVTIEEGCQIDGSILSHSCKVLSQAAIKESEIASGRIVAAGSKLNKEKVGHDAIAMD